MLLRVGTIALNTYRESVRARILLGLAGVAFSVALFSLVVGSFTLKNAPRVASDLGSASISLFGIAVAVVIGATSLQRELEQKTIFPILARPIGRGEYLTGKYLGTLLTLLVFIMADSGLVLLLAAGLGNQKLWLLVAAGLGSTAALVAAAIKWVPARTYGVIPWSAALLVLGIVLSDVAPDERRFVLASSTLAFLEIAIVTAAATLFSSFSTPFLSALLALGLWIIGRNADTMAHMPKKYFGPQIVAFFAALSKAVPNLNAYVPPRTLLTGEALDANTGQYLIVALGTAVAWSVVLITLATLVFKKRDFL
jgi:ABC-type transport system involved in multi-copper enzyme maturation permease subunit